MSSLQLAKTDVVSDANGGELPLELIEAALERFAQATGLGVVVCTDATGQPRRTFHASSPLLQLLRGQQDHALGEFERELALRCHHAAASCEDSYLSLLHVRALPLGPWVVLFGYSLSRFATSHDALHLARAHALSEARVLPVLRATAPLTPQRFAVYAELLETMLAAKQRHLDMIRELELQNRTRELLLAHVSHELRTPIMSSALRIQLLLESGLQDPEEVRRQLAALQSSVADEALLIEDLIETARTRTGQLHLDLAPTHLWPVLERAVEGASPRAQRKQLALGLSVLGDLDDALYADAARLTQVFSNLLSNAVKFTPSGGRIDVQLQPTPAWLEVQVADNGCGIEPALLGQVFDAFTQARPGSHKGLGLGLSVARQLVVLHGGEIRAESAGQGQGATFVVRLPRGPRAEATPLASRPQLLGE
jgi:signal transduction histidine kinase